MRKTNFYLLVNMRSGHMDGFYTRQEHAEQSLTFMNSRCQNREWLMAIVPEDQRKGFGIPNHLFHATAPDKQD